jgi:CHASE3 domain sensor protein
MKSVALKSTVRIFNKNEYLRRKEQALGEINQIVKPKQSATVMRKYKERQDKEKPLMEKEE